MHLISRSDHLRPVTSRKTFKTSKTEIGTSVGDSRLVGADVYSSSTLRQARWRLVAVLQLPVQTKMPHSLVSCRVRLRCTLLAVAARRTSYFTSVDKNWTENCLWRVSSTFVFFLGNRYSLYEYIMDIPAPPTSVGRGMCEWASCEESFLRTCAKNFDTKLANKMKT